MIYMNQLLTKILDAHGGMKRWNEYQKVQATIVSGGGLFQLKGVPQDSTPRRMSVWLHEERSSVFPYGAPDQRTMFTPERLTIEKLDGTVIAERDAPTDSFGQLASIHSLGSRILKRVPKVVAFNSPTANSLSQFLSWILFHHPTAECRMVLSTMIISFRQIRQSLVAGP
jgi:hypothetical protein